MNETSRFDKVMTDVLSYIVDLYTAGEIDHINLIHDLTSPNEFNFDESKYDKSLHDMIAYCMIAHDNYYCELLNKSLTNDVKVIDNDDLIEEIKVIINDADEVTPLDGIEKIESDSVNTISSHEVKSESFPSIDIDCELNDNDLLTISSKSKTYGKSLSEVKSNVDKILLSTDSSSERGRLGEDEVIDIIRQSRPDLHITKVSSTGHVGDIHIDDDMNDIKYVVECKLKQDITKSDLVKFTNDLNEIVNSYPNKYVYGIFVSLNTDTITTIGSTKCDRTSIYLTKSLVTKDVFRIVFDMVPIYANSRTMLVGNDTKKEVTEYVMSDNLKSLIARVHQMNSDFQEELSSLKKIDDNVISISTEAAKLRTKLLVKRNYITDLNIEFIKSGTPSEQLNVTTLESDEKFINYIRVAAKSKLTKKSLMNEFPQHKTELASINVKDLIAKYRPVK